MTIEIHIITYNEQIMLPFTIAHYRRMFGNPRIIIHDNGSTDNTVMLAKLGGYEVIPFTTDGMNDTIHRQIKTKAAMDSTSDWVMVLDCDECCCVNNNDLFVLEQKGIDVVEFQGWDIFDDVNTPWDIRIAKGCQSPGYCKPVLVRRASFSDIEFGAGAHNIERITPVEGKTEIIWSRREYNLIHYKHWSRKWHLSRSAELAKRQSQENLQRGYSTHFALPEHVHTDWYNRHSNSAIPIPERRLMNYQEPIREITESTPQESIIATSMHLNICTISSRTEYLDRIYESIPKEQDIVWHICRSLRTDVLTNDFLQDPRVKVYYIDCEDTNTPCKMNFIFHKIIEQGLDSYFCIQDDDSIFRQEMYDIYTTYREKHFMIIGNQEDKNGIIRLRGTLPYPCAVDTGMFLAHSCVLTKELWPSRHWDNEFHADYDFLTRVHDYFTIKSTDIIQDTISVYNAFSDRPDTLDYLRS